MARFKQTVPFRRLSRIQEARLRRIRIENLSAVMISLLVIIIILLISINIICCHLNGTHRTIMRWLGYSLFLWGLTEPFLRLNVLSSCKFSDRGLRRRTPRLVHSLSAVRYVPLCRRRREFARTVWTLHSIIFLLGDLRRKVF